MTASEPVLTDLTDGVATITLNRPDSLNSLTTEAKVALLSALRQAAEDTAVRVVVLTGAGRGFCVGQDLRQHVEQLQAGEDGPFTTVVEHYNPIALTITRMPKPVIARVNGVAAGAGLSLAMLADFRIAAESAKFATSFAGIGLSCDTGSSWTLQRLVGPSRAKQLLFDPSAIDSAEAARIGLVDAVVPDDQLDAEVTQRARTLAAGPTLAYAAMREAVDYAASHSLEESLEFEVPRMHATGQSQDHQNAVASFLAKKQPTFEGR